MTPDQKTVAIGAATGIASMLAAVWLLTTLIPAPLIADTVSTRLAYALGANIFALLPLFVMLIVIGNARFLSEAIDPTKHKEDAAMEIDGRVTDNTLQQNFVFAIVSLALSTLVPMQYLQVVWAGALWFIVARIAFWIGYRINPLYRAPGMSGTAYLNLGMILYVVYRLLF